MPDFTTKQRAYIDYMVENPEASQVAAAESVGISSETVRRWGDVVKDEIDRQRQLITAKVRQKIEDASLEAFRVMLELMQTAESETVRYNAAKDLLDRGGLKAIEKVDSSGELVVRVLRADD